MVSSVHGQKACGSSGRVGGLKVGLQGEGSGSKSSGEGGVCMHACPAVGVTGAWGDEKKNVLLVLCNVLPRAASPEKVLCSPDVSGAPEAPRARCVVCRPCAAGTRTAWNRWTALPPEGAKGLNSQQA